MADKVAADLARIYIVRATDTGLGLYAPEDSEQAMLLAPDEMVLATDPDNPDHMLFWGEFIDAFVMSRVAATGRLPSQQGIAVERLGQTTH